MTIRAVWAEQNGLDAGSPVAVELTGPALTLRALQTRPSLQALVAQTPHGPRRAEGWHATPSVGREA